ncbi:glycoside hydrolase [Exidia glandulosa HHB12029]|uniref:Glycoside hydrolase n=1 Tax=Exidia glandulosa HHB12029 TaxID=1314781 RepID=A0A165MTY5_EXIGL|nr:glycoside hydrolase [Exidia glandulosa HHB12029]
MVNKADLSEATRREIGQHFVVGFPEPTISEHITTLIRDYYVGNVIIFKRNIESFEHIKALVSKLQQLAKDSGHERPLMVGIDQENGLVSAFNPVNGQCGTQFPGAMALAATGSPELAEKTSAASGRELRAAGINWAYSPVCDVNSDSLNPVIGVRSYGDDPTQAAQYAEAVAKGLLSSSIAPCAKHFPGHGDTHVDSHLALPVIRKTKAQLHETELLPFIQLMKAGVLPTVMTGHMALPLVTESDVPCSLSRVITTETLRNDLKFDGVVVTDCLEMDAVSAIYGCADGSVRALEAGADIVMICHRLDRQVSGIEAAYEALKTGRISADELSRSGQRIAALKDKFAGSWDVVLDPAPASPSLADIKDSNLKLSKEAYDLTVALHADPSGVLPLSSAGIKDIVLITPEMARINPAVDAPPEEESTLRTADGAVRNTAGPSYIALANALGPALATHIVSNPRSPLSKDAIAHSASAAAVIFAARNASGDAGAWQIERLREVVALESGAKVLVISTCTPYDLVDAARVAPEAALLATFEFTKEALEAAVRVAFEEVKATGQIPVRLTK